ncbi:MAG: T9SS type A sorting domain-containing protein [Bacteroidota bacterium]
MKKYSLILFLTFSFNVRAQDTFEKMLWYYNDLGSFGTIVLQDSSIIIAFPHAYGFQLLKTDKDGIVTWIKTYSSNSPPDGLVNPQFLPTSDGNFIIAANRLTVIGQYNNTCLLKIDSAGTILWHRTYADLSSLESVNETSDHGFILSAYTTDHLIGNLHYNRIILKIDSAGSIDWSKIFPQDSIQNYHYDIVQTDDNGYLYESWVTSMKLDSVGNVVHSNWITRQFFGLGVSKFIRVNPNAYLYLNGSYLTCYDSTGNILWDRSNENKDIYSVNDSTILLLGSRGQIWWSSSIEKMDINGNSIAGYFFDIPQKVFSYSFAPMMNGRIILSCLTDPYQIQVYQLLLIKTDSNGFTNCGEVSFLNNDPFINNTISPYLVNSSVGNTYLVTDNFVSTPEMIVSSDTICYTTTTINQPYRDNHEFTMSPNPTHGIVNIITTTDIQNGLMELYNLLGERIDSKQYINGTKEISVDVTHLSSGIYFVKLQTEKGSSVQKVVVQ